MLTEPKVSIVIPIYNGADYMREAIDSALAQSYTNIEVLVVNDGSDDGGKTDQIARSYGERVRYFSKANGGVATALNLGLREMSGEYFSWLSHDDVYHSRKIEVQLDALHRQQHDNVIIYSDFELIDADSRVTGKVEIPHYEPAYFLYELIQRPFLHGCTLLIPAYCFKEVGEFDEKLFTTQDYKLWIQMALRYNFVHLPEELVQARQHAEQGTHKVSELHRQEVDDLNLWLLQKLDPEPIPLLYQISIVTFYQKLAQRYRQRNLPKSARATIKKAFEHAKKDGFQAYLKMWLFAMRQAQKRR